MQATAEITYLTKLARPTELADFTELTKYMKNYFRRGIIFGW